MSVAMPENSRPLDSTRTFSVLRDSLDGWFSGFGCEKNAPSSRPSNPSRLSSFTTSPKGIGLFMYGPTQYAQVPIEILLIRLLLFRLSDPTLLARLLVIADVRVLLVRPGLR